MNSAFLDRFFVSKLIITYLGAKLGDPMLNPNGIPVPADLPVQIVKFANSVREQFKKGQSEVSISTRGLLSFAEMIALRWTHVCNAPEDEVKFVASKTLLGPVSGVLRATLLRLLVTEVIDGKRWHTALATHGGKAPGNRAAPVTGNAVKVTLHVNPNRQGSGNVTVWGYIEGKTSHTPFSGSLTGQKRLTWHAPKSCAQVIKVANEKIQQRCYVLPLHLVLPAGEGVKLTSAAFVNGFPDAFVCPADLSRPNDLGLAVERALIQCLGTSARVLR
jgi:hypothetical protein